MRPNRHHHNVRWLLPLLLALACHASAASWNEKVLYSFQGGSDGQTPAGGVVFDSQGNLYGATEAGTVFQLAPPAKKGDPWTETVLYIFLGKSNNNDGLQPSGGLVIDNSGNLYGTTAYGGTGGCILLGILYGCGTVYELSAPQQKGGQWTETILYSFQGGNDGYYPWGNLTFDKSGNLYGATQFGGGKSTQCDPYYQYCGTVFNMSPPKQKGGAWTEQVLHSFAGGTDGVNPNGGLILDSKGAIYGTTPTGGNQLCNFGNGNVGCGIVFRLAPQKKSGAWTEKVLHSFTDGSDGAGPGSLVLGVNGSLYSAASGGAKGGGVIFRLAAGSGGHWKETVVYEFSSNTYGFGPGVSHFDRSGNLFGTTYDFPESYSGSVFRLRPPILKGKPWVMSFLYKFTGVPDGVFPYPNLASDKHGDLYGTTLKGGNTEACYPGGCGIVFAVSP